MGQYFTNVAPEFVQDKMLELPIDLMTTAVTTIDKNIDDTFSTLDEQWKALNVKGLDVDTPEAKKRMQMYQNKMANISETINGDLLNYHKSLGSIRELSREIDQDINTGYLAAYADNKKKLDGELKTVKGLKNKDAESVGLLKKAIINNYGGLNYDEETGVGNNIEDNFIQLHDKVSGLDVVNKVGQGYKLDKESTQRGGPDGKGRIWLSTTSDTKLDEETLKNTLKTSLTEEGWDDYMLQKFQIRRDAKEEGWGNLTDEEIQNKVNEEKEKVIAAGIDKIYYKDHETKKSITMDSAHFQNKTLERTNGNNYEIDVKTTLPTSLANNSIGMGTEKINNFLEKYEGFDTSLDYFINGTYTEDKVLNEINKMNLSDKYKAEALLTAAIEMRDGNVNYNNPNIIDATTPKIDNYNPDDKASVSRNKEELRKLVTEVRTLGGAIPINLRVIQNGETSFAQNTTLNAVQSNRLLHQDTNAIVVEEVPKTNLNGEIMIQVGNQQIAAIGKTEAELKAEGVTIVYEEVKKPVSNIGNNLLSDVKPSEITAHTRTVYKNGKKFKEKYYVVTKTNVVDGKSTTVYIEINDMYVNSFKGK